MRLKQGNLPPVFGKSQTLLVNLRPNAVETLHGQSHGLEGGQAIGAGLRSELEPATGGSDVRLRADVM